MAVGFRLTSKDLERMPDIEGIRYELIGGELHVSRAPGAPHQHVCTKLISSLDLWATRTAYGLVLGGPGLVLAEGDDVIPDVIWISHERWARGLDDKGHFTIAPELVVEVLSPGSVNERRDREYKLQLYSRRDVQEYWIIDWEQRGVEVYRRDGSELRLVETLVGTDAITSPLLPGFSCSVSSLWIPQPA